MSNVYSQRFSARLDALRVFADREGTTDVPLAHVEATEAGDVDLGRWVAYIRARHRKGLLPPDRVAPLEALPGWSWEVRRPGPRPLAERNAAIRGMRSQGASLDVIAETFGLSKQRVHQLLQRGH